MKICYYSWIAVTLGLSALKAIQAGKLKLKLGENSLAKQIKQEIDTGKFVEATDSWSNLEDVISRSSNSVDFYNFLLDSGMDPVSLTASELSEKISIKRYSRYLNSLRRAATPGGDGDVDTLMNGVIKKKLKIIPKDVVWGGQSDYVFSALEGDFMKPRIDEVDELLAKGVNLTVYSGQLDVICSTKGTEAWVEKLKYPSDADKHMLARQTGLSRNQSSNKDQSRTSVSSHFVEVPHINQQNTWDFGLACTLMVLQALGVCDYTIQELVDLCCTISFRKDHILKMRSMKFKWNGRTV